MNLETKLSNSKLAVFKSCSLKFHYQYGLKICQKSNEGAEMGTITHNILECISHPRHKNLYTALLNSESIDSCPTIERYTQSQIKKRSLSDKAYDKINSFVMLAAKTDFFNSKGEFLSSEKYFDITSEEPPYRIVGFIDQLARFGEYIRIKDFKTQSKPFEGESREANSQAYIYALAAKKLYGNDKKIVIDFLMLNFPEQLIFRVKPTDTQLAGFEQYLSQMFEKISNFTEADKFSNVAALHIPQDGEGFVGALQCGWNRYQGFVKKDGELKKDGTERYHCPFRFKFSYFALCNKDGDVIKTAFEKKDLKPKKGEFIIPKKHPGCQFFTKK